jgi:3-deoxy-manno-octulosonate cytidylyltransferase (CMP-KDO synthetase)
MTNFAIFIPARLASTRLPNKMLRKIGDKSMISHVVDRSQESSINNNNIFVATDAEEIIEDLRVQNVKCIMTSKEHYTGSDRIFEALQKTNHEEFQYIINLQGDVPFIDPKLIDLLKITILSSNYDILTLASPITEQDKINDPNVVKIAIALSDENKQHGQAIYFSRQPIPHNAKTYYEHSGIYLYKKEALEKFVSLSRSSLEIQEQLEQLRALENNLRIGVLITPLPQVNIDTHQDLEKAILSYKVSK